MIMSTWIPLGTGMGKEIMKTPINLWNVLPGRCRLSPRMVATCWSCTRSSTSPASGLEKRCAFGMRSPQLACIWKIRFGNCHCRILKSTRTDISLYPKREMWQFLYDFTQRKFLHVWCIAKGPQFIFQENNFDSLLSSSSTSSFSRFASTVASANANFSILDATVVVSAENALVLLFFQTMDLHGFVSDEVVVLFLNEFHADTTGLHRIGRLVVESFPAALIMLFCIDNYWRFRFLVNSRYGY